MPSDAVSSNHRLRVVHVASGDLWAGAEVQLYHLAAELQKLRDMDLHVVLLNHGVLEQRLRSAGVAVTVLDERRLGTLRIWRRILTLLRSLRPDIVHTHRRKENVLGALASLCVPGAQLVRTVHGAQEFTHRSWNLRRRLFSIIEYLCSRYLFQRIIAVSTALAADISKEFPPQKVCVIENGIDVHQVLQNAASGTSLPGGPGRIRVGIAGRLVPVKRIDIFLQIAKVLLDTDPDRYAFYVFGDGPLFQAMEDSASQLQIDSHIHFLGFSSHILPWLASLDILLITSDHEGLPMVLLEAMALSVPVIAHAVGAIPDVLDHGRRGTLIANQDIGLFAKEISRFAQDPEPYKNKATTAFSAVNQRYSSQTCADRYHHLYAALLPDHDRDQRRN